MKGLVGVPIGNSPDTKLTSITKSINFLFEIKFLSTQLWANDGLTTVAHLYHIFII